MLQVTYAGEPRQFVDGPLSVGTIMPSSPAIDIPSIMRAGGFEEGVKAERARVIAWLRDQGERTTEPMAMAYADALMHGDHEREP